MGRNVSRLSLSAAAVAAARASESVREERRSVCCLYRAAVVLGSCDVLAIPRYYSAYNLLINAFFYGGKSQSHFDSMNNKQHRVLETSNPVGRSVSR
jgi:hypothetical protein